MVGGTGHSGDRLELLAGEAAGDLSEEESGELGLPDNGRDPGLRTDFIAAAALVQLAFLKADPPSIRPMPASLESRLSRQAADWLATARPGAVMRVTAPVRHAPRRRRWLSAASTGWYLAAMLAMALVVPRSDTPGTRPVIAATDAREELMRTAQDLIVVPWSPSTVAGFENVTGDVVWSNSRQEGYLRLAGVPVNEPVRSQYQLWIVDPERDSHPVDGGVFDVTTTDMVTISVHPGLPIVRPTAFAITAERPGGVVVSDGPMLVLAAVGS
jgi:anti-sigma-K factor RskA